MATTTARPTDCAARPKAKLPAKKVRLDKKGRRIYTLADLKKMDAFILPPEPEWEAEWERRTGLKAQP